jgi:thioester reductase-like protein
VLVARIPRSAHGKVDLDALPPAAIEPVAAAAPEGHVETVIAAIWSSLLDVPDVGRTDSFYALGGSSLLATRVLAAIERELGRTVPLAVLLEADDLADLARALSTGPAPAPDLRAERLPADVVPTVRRSSPMRRVLVTGATGFLGAHLVAELLATTDTTVECLVRADTAEQARQRVLQNLSGYGLPADPRRIVGLAGDLAKPRFGLTERAWSELAHRCDVICHNGGAVNSVESYERLRPANVGGTVEALRLAALGGASVHAVSTLGVYAGATHAGKPITELDAPGEPEALSTGYEQTKSVADRLCRDARAAGLAVSLHRPARIGGHSITGRSNPDDYFNRLLTTFVQTGCVPDLPWTEDLAPVDHVAAGVVRLLGEPAGRDFHYFNPATISYQELAAALVDRGYDVQLVPWETWRAAVNGRLAAGEPLALAPFVTSVPEQRPAVARPEFDCAATERAAGTFPPADRELVGRQLDFLVSAGRIPGGAGR